MAKINIVLNSKSYSIDDSIIATATATLKSHLSTVMNGTGSVIHLDGNTYNVSSEKLTTAKNNFISHLGSMAGNGHKVVVGGVEYGIDAGKVDSVITELGGAWEGSQSGGNDGYKELESAPEEFMFGYIDPSNQNLTLFDVVGAAQDFGVTSMNAHSLSNFLIMYEDEFTSADFYEMIVVIGDIHDAIIADYAYTYFRTPARYLTEEQRYELLYRLLPTDARSAILEAQINYAKENRIIITMDTDAEGYPIYYYSMRT